MCDRAPPRPVPQMDVGAFYRAHRGEIDAAVARVLDSGWYVLGTEGDAFEAEFSAMFGYGGAVGVASGTDALILALKALDIGRGDRVITVSHTAVATVAAIEIAGAEPVLVDIDPVSFTMDPADLERALAATAGVKAVIVVHLYGQPADLPILADICKRRGVKLIEDCAQAHGARVGARFVGGFGDIAAFSFYPTKNLGAFGDGGAVCASDPTLLETLRALRQYGWRRRYVSDIAGMNSRLDEIQAAILRARLPQLEAGNRRRREIAAAYRAGLAGLDLVLPVEREGTTHVYHQYVVRCRDRDALCARLRAARVGFNIHYPVPVHLQPAYEDRLIRSEGGLASTEAAAREVWSERSTRSGRR